MDLLKKFVSHEEFPTRESVYVRWYPKTLSHISGDPLHCSDILSPKGIYIHVPFCDRLCRFCPFNKRQSDDQLISRFQEALLQEISLYGERLQPGALDFIYFGGGTPSVLSADQISCILARIDKEIGSVASAEVTLESHPTHLDRDYAKSVKNVGVTRISTGIQSFDDAMLSRLGAQHTAKDALDAIDSTTAIFGQVSIDLLFRCPGQTLEQWESQLTTAAHIPEITHISCYSLVLKDSLGQPSAAEEAAMTVLAHEVLSGSQFKHYASCASGGFDFAFPGNQCRYEIGHWGAPQSEFIGLGPGAFGFLAKRTTVNGLDVKRYCDVLAAHRLPLVSNTSLDREEEMRRYFVLGVKTLSVPLQPFRAIWGCESAEVFQAEFEQLRRWQFATIDQDELTLTDVGRMFVDTISAQFFSEHERFVAHPEEPEIRAVEVIPAREAMYRTA